MQVLFLKLFFLVNAFCKNQQLQLVQAMLKWYVQEISDYSTHTITVIILYALTRKITLQATTISRISLRKVICETAVGFILMQLRMSNINFSGCLMCPKNLQETNLEKKHLCFSNGHSLKIKQNGVFFY